MLLPLEEGRCACAKARYAASQAVASLGERVHCCCGYVWPYGLRGTQRTHHRWWCLGRRARAVALVPRGGEVRVCESTVRGLSGSGIAGRSECTAAAAVCGLTACTARGALTTSGGAWGRGLELLLLPSRRRGARVRKHGTRPLGQWHRWEKRVHCCCGCVWPCGLHSTQSTHYRWW